MSSRSFSLAGNVDSMAHRASARQYAASRAVVACCTSTLRETERHTSGYVSMYFLRDLSHERDGSCLRIVCFLWSSIAGGWALEHAVCGCSSECFTREATGKTRGCLCESVSSAARRSRSCVRERDVYAPPTPWSSPFACGTANVYILLSVKSVYPSPRRRVHLRLAHQAAFWPLSQV